ncbi:catechol 2,3-dioxygenase-like lactoylglutathione lyase family enzyme [Tumebacillus sp. BK434]|uniref:ArsI/CadI family heavy metal resistance metalloenzyme n=1 Tax=Tumebacillus sp. BK434 TaxID=2512169 RepID=UPI0010D9ECA9|nr:ArsI/CadI family heavy metal resistance metalloenzyme [Tumebacillus sp. BK434]TCP58142.1 catechol 2,3-dioxygenase-like lactoylglutathione lyase family enzyme [Tumebacillus sp. BK434]
MTMRMHVAINVTELESSLAFYKAFFGAEPTKVRENYAKFELEDPQLHFSLNVRPYETRGVLNHMGFQVENTEAVLQMKSRLQATGLVALDEMNTTCCYAVQDKIWVHDPEGNAWEVFYTKEDSEFESARVSGDESVCCVTPAVEQNEQSECCSVTVSAAETTQSTGGCGCSSK